MTDIFDSCVHLEEEFIQRGREEGIREGEVSGLLEGRDLGVRKGLEVGAEVGYYSGCVQAWRFLQAECPDAFSERAKHALVALESSVGAFQADPQDEELQERLQQIRGKFKTIVAMLGLQHNYFSKVQAAGSFSEASF